MRFLSSIFTVLVVTATSLAQVPATPNTSYHVGNQLSAETFPIENDTIAEFRGSNWNVGFSFYELGLSLPDILSTSSFPMQQSPGGSFFFQIADINWEYLVLQTDSSGNYPVAEHTAAVEFLYDLSITESPTIVLFGGWGIGENVTRDWNTPYDEELFVHSREFYDLWYDEVAAVIGPENVRYVPSGEIWQRIAQEIQDGNTRLGSSLDEFFSNSELSPLLSNSGELTMLYAIHYVMSDAPIDYYPALNAVDFQRVEEIQRIIRDVLHEDRERTKVTLKCIGDVDGNGGVQIADLLRLLGNYGNPDATYFSEGDVNEDNSVDFADLLVVLGSFGNNCFNGALD